jgi:hypothetical protein
LARLEPVTQKLEPMTRQPAIPNVGFVGMQCQGWGATIILSGVAAIILAGSEESEAA